MRELVTMPAGGWLLHGVVHEPERAERRVGVVLLHQNVGGKVGPHAILRRLGDALAEEGFHALRFDNRGNNDSPGFNNLPFAARVEDARAAVAFFRRRYRLEAVVGWGLCMGAAVAVHTAHWATQPEEKLDGLILCNILAHPEEISVPQFNYQRANPVAFAQQVLFEGNFFRKLQEAPRRLPIYRRNLPPLLRNIFRRYWLRFREPEFNRLRVAVARVGELLAAYPGPCLLIFGEKDRYRRRFFLGVNPGDRLGLNRKPIPPQWATVRNGNHSFASAEQMAEMIRHTLDWLDSFVGQVRRAGGRVRERGEDGVSVAPVGN